MKKEIIQVIGFLAPAIIMLNRKRLASYINGRLQRRHLLKRAPVLFGINKQGELANIQLVGMAISNQGRRFIPVRPEDSTLSSPLTEKQIKKLDGLYKCLCNETLSKTEIVIRTYATLLELTEEQLEAFRGYLF